jgi:hypothetical protein
MSLDDLDDDVTAAHADFGDELTVGLDRETRNELAMLQAAMETDGEELVRRAVHMLFQTAVETGTLDFHLRSKYDVTYDEFLSGMTYDEMGGGGVGGGDLPQAGDDDRRYQF